MKSYQKFMQEVYKLQLIRDKSMDVLKITDTKNPKTKIEVRGKKGYEIDGYDKKDRLHSLLDKIGKSANMSDLVNGEVVSINPKHPDARMANKTLDKIASSQCVWSVIITY